MGSVPFTTSSSSGGDAQSKKPRGFVCVRSMSSSKTERPIMVVITFASSRMIVDVPSPGREEMNCTTLWLTSERRELMLWYKAVISRSRLNSRSTETRGTVGVVVRGGSGGCSAGASTRFSMASFSTGCRTSCSSRRACSSASYILLIQSPFGRAKPNGLSGDYPTFSGVSQRGPAGAVFSPRNEGS